MEWLHTYWGPIGFFLTCGAGGMVAFIVVSRVRVPLIEKRMQSGDERMGKIEAAIKEGSIRLTDEDGVPKYILRKECHDMRTSCQTGIDDGIGGACDSIDELRHAVDRLVRIQGQNRTLQISFMAAVREKLDLKFSIPKE